MSLASHFEIISGGSDERILHAMLSLSVVFNRPCILSINIENLVL